MGAPCKVYLTLCDNVWGGAWAGGRAGGRVSGSADGLARQRGCYIDTRVGSGRVGSGIGLDPGISIFCRDSETGDLVCSREQVVVTFNMVFLLSNRLFFSLTYRHLLSFLD